MRYRAFVSRFMRRLGPRSLAEARRGMRMAAAAWRARRRNPAKLRDVSRVWGESGWQWTAYGRCEDGYSTNGWGGTEAAAKADLERQCARRRRNPARKKKRRPTGGDWQPDLFGGAGKQRREGLTRAEQMELAREEMRDAGGRDLFDLEPRQGGLFGNPTDIEDQPGKPGRYQLRDRETGRIVASNKDQRTAIRLATDRDIAERRRRRARNPDQDTPQRRYANALEHGERRAVATRAAANPGHAVGRLTVRCPGCDGTLRLPNPPPPRVTCAGCNVESLVRRP